MAISEPLQPIPRPTAIPYLMSDWEARCGLGVVRVEDWCVQRDSKYLCWVFEGLRLLLGEIDG